MHYLLYCHHSSRNCIYLTNSVNFVSENFNSMPDNVKKEVLLYGDPRLDENKNKFILEATLFYIKSIERFSGSIFN